METKDKRKSPCYRSQGAGLKLKMVQSFKLERSLVFCCKTKLQQRLNEERVRREALQEELTDHKIIIEELVQQYIHLEDGLTLKFDDFAKASAQKLQQLETEKQQLLDQISDQKQTTRELFEKLTEERLKNLNLKEQLDQRPGCKQDKEIKKLEKSIHDLQKTLSEEREHKQGELRMLEESIRELNQKLCEEKNTGLELEEKLHRKFRREEDIVQTNSKLLLDLNEEKQNIKKVESRLKGKEEYIRLLKRDLCEREALFKSHLRLINEKMEKKSAACRELRGQLQQERENSEGLELLSAKLMEELDKQMMEQLSERPAPAQRPHWKQVCSRLTPDIYRRWARKRKNQKASQRSGDVEQVVKHVTSLQTCMD